VQWFRGGLVFKAHRLLYNSTLGLRLIKKKKRRKKETKKGKGALPRIDETASWGGLVRSHRQNPVEDYSKVDFLGSCYNRLRTPTIVSRSKAGPV
jgi:hypothetical protein